MYTLHLCRCHVIRRDKHFTFICSPICQHVQGMSAISGRLPISMSIQCVWGGFDNWNHDTYSRSGRTHYNGWRTGVVGIASPGPSGSWMAANSRSCTIVPSHPHSFSSINCLFSPQVFLGEPTPFFLSFFCFFLSDFRCTENEHKNSQDTLT